MEKKKESGSPSPAKEIRSTQSRRKLSPIKHAFISLFYGTFGEIRKTNETASLKQYDRTCVSSTANSLSNGINLKRFALSCYRGRDFIPSCSVQV